MKLYFLNTIICLALAIFSSPEAWAWGLRVDLDGSSDEMELTPARAGGDSSLKNVLWGDPTYQQSHLFFQRNNLPDGQAAELEFSFVSHQSGYVTIRLNGCWSSDPTSAQWVVYTDVEAHGATIINGDFSERTSSGKLKNWALRNNAALLTQGVKARNEASVSQRFKVEAGKPVKIKLVAREASLDDEMAVVLPPPVAITFEHEGWQLSIDGENGVWKDLKWQGSSLYSNPAGLPPFTLTGEETWGERRLVDHSFDSTSGVASIITSNGDWTFEERLTLGKRLKREVMVTFNGGQPVKFKNLHFYFYLPKAGSYYFPGSLFGDTRHYMAMADKPPCEAEDSGELSEMKDGSIVKGIYNCYFSFIEQTPSRTLMFTFDGGREQTRASFQAAKNYVRGDTYVKAMGWAMPGVPQLIGPAYIEIFDGDVQAALKKAPHAWFRDVGMLPPADRPDWVRDVTSLWVFCPSPYFGGVDGLRGATEEMIPYAKKRGANTFWLLPMYKTSWPYAVRDYYQFRPDVGSYDDYRAFLRSAKANGFRVWQDIVPHGGSVKYGPERGVSPFTVSIAENGEFVQALCYDYASSEWREYIGDVASYYTKNFDIDGFRIDQPSFSPMNWRRPGFPLKAPKNGDAEWWNDAVAENGGDIPPVEGQRGSSSLVEGGTLITKEIRDSVRENKPEGAVLAETGNISCALTGDAIFDFYIRRVGLKMPLFDGEATARELARYLEEQQLTDPPDTIRVRFFEVHDADQQRFTNWCGQNAGQALRSTIYWSKGMPQVLAHSDVGMGALLQRLNAIRTALPELRRGEAEYQAVGSSPSVFAVLRSMPNSSSIGITSFLPEEIKTTLEIPIEKLGFTPNSEVVLYNTWTGETLGEGRLESFRQLELELPAYGNAVLTWRPVGEPCPLPSSEPLDFTTPSAQSLKLKENADEFVIEGAKKLVIDRNSGLLKQFGDWLDGSSILSDQALLDAPANVVAKIENGVATVTANLACGANIRYELRGSELEITGSLENFSIKERMAFVLSATNAKRWQVNSIEGKLDDFIDKSIIELDSRAFLPVYNQSYRPNGSPILWHSEIKPLNPSAPYVRIFDEDRKGFEIQLDSPLSTGYDDMMLLSKLPGDPGLHAAIFWVQPGPLSLADTPGPRTFKVVIRPAAKKIPFVPAIVDGVEISHESMFWRLKNAEYTLRLTRNGGAIKTLVGKKGGPVFSDQDIIIVDPELRATLDLETGVRCFSEDGKLKLRFLSALRNGANQGLPSPPIWAVTEYSLDATEQVVQSLKVYVDSPTPCFPSSSSPLEEVQVAYVARQGSKSIEIPILDESGNLPVREFLDFTAVISASGDFQVSPIHTSKADTLDWKRYFQMNSTGSAGPLPLMIASSTPGNALLVWNSSDTRFAPGHSAPAAIETRMPGFSYFGPYVDLKPGKYLLKTWIKGKNITIEKGNAFVELRLDWFRDGKVIHKLKRFEIPQGSFDWQPFEAELDVEEGTTMPVAIILRTSFDSYGEGTIWADLPQWETIPSEGMEDQ